MAIARGEYFDVVVAGGGLAGSVLAGVLARGGLGVLVVEREAVFRDRVHGETTWPWGVHEVFRLGLEGVLRNEGGCIDVAALDFYEQRSVVRTRAWEAEPMLGFSHPRLQETMLAWAAAQGARVIRPAKAMEFVRNGGSTVRVLHDGEELEFRCRLVAGADGRLSGVRRWLGAETLGEDDGARFGGVLVSGVPFSECLDVSLLPGLGAYRFNPMCESARLYLYLSADRIRETGVDRSLAALTGMVGSYFPDGTIAGARANGPIAFFPNSASWPSRIAGDGIALVGDAAGRSEPAGGLGTSLLYRDARELSELLLAERDWEAAISEYARRRTAYYDVVRHFDRWNTALSFDEGPGADARRERNARAREADPTLGGFAMVSTRGPDGLVVTEKARRHYFGEDLA